ncbi:leucine-rich repeat-containing protein [Tanacetum coccineum]
MNRPSSPIHLFCDENVVRKTPGHVGILQAAKLCKTTEITEGGHDCKMATQEYVRKIIEDASEDGHLTHGPWLSAVQYLAAEGGMASEKLSDFRLRACHLDKFLPIQTGIFPINLLGPKSKRLNLMQFSKDTGNSTDKLYVKFFKMSRSFPVNELRVCARSYFHGSKGLFTEHNLHHYGGNTNRGRGPYSVDYSYIDHLMIEWQGMINEFSRNLGLVETIDLSSNSLTRQIPYEITNLHGLILLNWSHNAQLGEIPKDIG